MARSLCGVILFLCATICCAQKGGSFQSISPCPSQAIFIQKPVGGPPGKRNTWNGVISLEKWPNLPHVELFLTLDHSAKLSLSNSDRSGQLSAVDGGYKIIYHLPSSEVKEIYISAKGSPNSGFPTPTSLHLNGADICEGQAQVTTDPSPTLDNKFSPDEIQAQAPTCGKRKIHHQGLVTHGYPTQEGEWPWHAALYLRKSSDSSRYICGGTLISSELVITAGHCITEGGHAVTPDRITVRLGLHNRAVANSNAQEYPVYDAILHENFDFTSLKNDISILKLAHRVTFNSYIQPVCLWPSSSVALESVVGKGGTIIGWGLDEVDQLSDILKQGTMPVVDVTTCLESNPDFFGGLLTSSNFCAGYRNGTSVCNGDSGGGMFFNLDDTYYIRGIVSLAVAQSNKAVCNPRHYALFTDVAKYLNWIESHTRRQGDGIGRLSAVNGGYKITYHLPSSQVRKIHLSAKGNPNSGFPTPTSLYLNRADICKGHAQVTTGPSLSLDNKFSPDGIQAQAQAPTCGKRKIHHQGLVTHGYPTQEGEWPWHAALYLRKSSDSSRYICGGTLISSELVITAGHCITEGGHAVTPDRITVRLGLHNRAVANSNAQEYPVYDAILHENFDFASLKNDISILKLAHRVTFNSYIQPVCLWPSNSVSLDSVVGHGGTIIGWGLNEVDQLSDILKQGTMPVVDVTTCLQSNPDFFSGLLTNSNFCAGYRNGTSVCNGDSGGGMFFNLNGSYYIRGIVSLAVAQSNKALCNPRHYALFTDVAKYLNWIESHTRRRRRRKSLFSK